jgi:hypothetical protein
MEGVGGRGKKTVKYLSRIVGKKRGGSKGCERYISPCFSTYVR